MYTKIVRLGSLFFLLSVALVVNGAPQTFNDVSIPVDDQTESSKELGFQAAMQQFLIKLSGSEQTLHNPAIQEAFKQPNLYIQSYRYYRRSFDQRLMLNVSFDTSSIEQILIEEGAQVWGRSRPHLLYWLSLDHGSGPRLVNSGYRVLEGWVEQSMSDRGIRFDLNKAIPSDVSLSKLWSLSLNEAKQVMRQQGYGGALLGRVRKVGQSLSYRGYLLEQGQKNLIVAESFRFDQLMSSVAKQVATILSSKYAFKHSALMSTDAVQITVSGIRSFHDYRSLLDYLNSKIGIASASPVQIQGTRVTLNLTLNSQMNILLRTFAVDRALQKTAKENQFSWNSEALTR